MPEFCYSMCFCVDICVCVCARALHFQKCHKQLFIQWALCSWPPPLMRGKLRLQQRAGQAAASWARRGVVSGMVCCNWQPGT